jgi:hypothetical protein
MTEEEIRLFAQPITLVLPGPSREPYINERVDSWPVIYAGKTYTGYLLDNDYLGPNDIYLEIFEKLYRLGQYSCLPREVYEVRKYVSICQEDVSFTRLRRMFNLLRRQIEVINDKIDDLGK